MILVAGCEAHADKDELRKERWPWLPNLLSNKFRNYSPCQCSRTCAHAQQRPTSVERHLQKI